MEKKQKRRLASFITAMSVFVSTGVFWQLRGIGTAMTDETLTANEYDTAAALSASNGSLCETDVIWESTLPELTNEPAENAALIAASQLGYTENKQNYILGGDGFTHKNYSRYGAWFGNPYGDWNTMFTCFCLYYAGVKEADIPFGSGCWAWSLKLNEKGMLLPLNRGSPKRGDVLLLDTDLDGKADRSGIISDISESCINTIEGQVDGAVAECSYAPDDEHITGYVPVEAPENGNVSLMEFSAESESGIKVFASAERGIFPDGTKMLAADIPRSEALEKAAEALDTEADDIEAVAVDISFCSTDGIELEPTDSSSVHVEIVLPEEQKLGGGEYNLLHIADSGDTEIIENAEVSENGAEFDAERFSIYVLTSDNNYHDISSSFTINGHSFPNSESNPYTIVVGDTIKIRTKAEKWAYTDDQNNTSEQGYPYFPNNQNILSDIAASYSYSEVTEGNITYRVIEHEYQATGLGLEHIQLTDNHNWDNSHLYINVVDENPQYYVWRRTTPIPASELTFNNEITPNSEANPYIVYVGQTFDVFLSKCSDSNGDFSLPNNEADGAKKLDPVYDPEFFNPTSITYNGKTINGCRRRFTALSPGYVQCQTSAGNHKRTFYIKVVDPGANNDENKPKLYVKSSFEDKPVNQVKEWLDGYGMPVDSEGYIPNAVGKTANIKYTNEYDNEWGRPYTIRVGDSFEIYANETGNFSLSNYDLNYGEPTSWNYDLKQSASSKLTQIATTGTYSAGTTANRFQGIAPGEVQITFTNQSGVTQIMWVRILEETEVYDHADMEIADGGKYTVASTSYVNGQKITTLKVYDAYVSRVNSAKLFDKSGDPLPLKPRDSSEYEYQFTSDGEQKSTDRGLLVGDYVQIGVAGSTQYELSSAYGRPKQFNIKDVENVTFNVNVKLIPERQCTITDGVFGQWESISGENEIEVKNVIWNFDEQGIVDAINKCPMTNGLDFTIRANAAIVDLKAIKHLNGGDLEAGQFTFQLYDNNNNPVGSPVTNDINGNIEFLNQKFEETGTFTYSIKEVIPTDGTQNPHLIYAADQDIIINVTEINVPNGSGGYIKALKAEIANPPPTLTNYVTFTLPSTGGGGVVPYMITGSAIIILSFAALLRKRKEDK